MCGSGIISGALVPMGVKVEGIDFIVKEGYELKWKVYIEYCWRCKYVYSVEAFKSVKDYYQIAIAESRLYCNARTTTE